MDNIVSLIIDGERVTAGRADTVLHAARENGIHIPTLCFVEGVSAPGGCRLCLVEVEGKNILQPACTTPVEQDMIVRTHSARVKRYRKMIVELMLAEGNHVCTACTANGLCELQMLAEQLGVDDVRFAYFHPIKHKDETHARFVLDQNMCILCARCVRVCDEIEHARSLDIAGKGINAAVITDMGEDWGDSASCTSCGKCVTVCPTGSIYEKGKSSAEIRAIKSFMSCIEARDRT